MKMKCAVLAAMLFASNILGADGVEYLKTKAWLNSVSITSTNLVLRFHSHGGILWIWDGDDFRNNRRLQYDEEFVLTPDQQTTLCDRRHVEIIFDPVSYKNQQRGFRITDITVGALAKNNSGIRINNLVYLALSDTPVQVGEDDVEMIMENGEWKTYEKPQPAPNEEGGAQPSPPSREPAQPAAVETPPVALSEPADAQPVIEKEALDVAAVGRRSNPEEGVFCRASAWRRGRRRRGRRPETRPAAWTRKRAGTPAVQTGMAARRTLEL